MEDVTYKESGRYFPVQVGYVRRCWGADLDPCALLKGWAAAV